MNPSFHSLNLVTGAAMVDSRINGPFLTRPGKMAIDHASTVHHTMPEHRCSRCDIVADGSRLTPNLLARCASARLLER